MSRILLADDSPHAQRMGERILREEGYEVVSVTDGDTALRRLADVDPDLIVADVFLPRVSGFELCRKVKANSLHKHVRVIMTAGMLEVFDEDEARRAGADAIIKKPFEASAVVAAIKPLIKEARAERGSPRSEPAAEAKPAAARHSVVIVEHIPEPEPKVIEPVPVREPIVVSLGPNPVIDPVPQPVHVKEPLRVVVAPSTPEPPPAPAPAPEPIVHRSAMVSGELDPELIRASVTVALDEVMPLLIDDITERVVAAMRKNQ